MYVWTREIRRDRRDCSYARAFVQTNGALLKAVDKLARGAQGCHASVIGLRQSPNLSFGLGQNRYSSAVLR